VDDLAGRYEMATLESALAFLRGAWQPRRPLCLLTFDDGLKEHAAEVTDILSERGIQGIFFIITGCAEEGRVAPVHMNHFLMAAVEFNTYRREFLESFGEAFDVDPALARSTYQWDTPDVAAFKYLFNFVLDVEKRDEVVRGLFTRHFGAEDLFARTLYLNWKEARAMQSAGMVIGGHSHRHRPLAKLSPAELRADLEACRMLLDTRLHPQAAWPFSFPYGKATSYSAFAFEELRRLGFACAFTTEVGDNSPGADPFGIRRIDCKHSSLYKAGTSGDRGVLARAQASAGSAAQPSAVIAKSDRRP
jgi:peptidoglycan/xylan/chitin deacetylase (PgdA/CDA1 family)